MKTEPKNLQSFRFGFLDKPGENMYKVSKDDKNENDPQAIYRIYSVISYIIVLIVIGLPVWWITTRVYRADLPLSEIHEIELGYRIDKPYGIPLSLDYDILITIVNPSPDRLTVEIDGELLDKNLQPFLDLAVSNFTIKTQWLYLTELGVQPKKEGDNYYLQEEQLPHVITPLEKKLWSHLSLNPCINLVLYVSNCQTKLYIRDKSNNVIENNSFLSSRWGGISILNPDSDSCEEGTYAPDLNGIISLFKKHLRHLLQINGRSDQDILNFKLDRISQMMDSTKRTLKSLAQLLSEINSIVISDDVADKINIAIKMSQLTEKYLEVNNIDLALQSAQVAYKNSEAAFSDPSLLALLYFPDDQKYAIYIPLFLPVMIPVLMSIMTIRRWRKNNRITKLKSA